MKKSCSRCCLTCPVLALWLLRIIVAVIFIMAGVGKLTNVTGFQTLIEGLGYPEGIVAAIVAYFVIAAELLGGIAMLVRKWLPKCLGKLLILSIIPVMAGIIFHIDVPAMQAGNPMGFMMNLQLAAAVYVIASVCPKCPFGISGCKTMDGSCPTKKGKK